MSDLVRNEDLQPGDVIVPWYERRARVVRIVPYRGPLACILALAELAPEGADGFQARSLSLERGGYSRRAS